MSKFTDEKFEKLAKIIGLTEEQAKVYSAVISLGGGTLGQISIVAGVDILQTNEVAKHLVTTGFLRANPGIITRYYPLEPFLKAFILSYDTIAIVSLKDYFKKRVDKIQIIDDESRFKDYLKKELSEVRSDILNEIKELDDSEGVQEKIEKFTVEATETLVEICTSLMVSTNKRIHKTIGQVSNELEIAVERILFSLKETKDNLIDIFEASRSLDIPPVINSDILIGEPSIVLMMRDLVRRTRNSITILMPKPELQSLMIAVKIIQEKRNRRVVVIGDLNKVPTGIRKKLLDANLQLKQMDQQIDFWAVIRDDEEILFAPESKEAEQMTGIISQNHNLIELLRGQILSYSVRARKITD